MQTSLFAPPTPCVPSTEGIKYAGSKLKILPYILECCSDIDFQTVLDGFSGSTRVSQVFAKLGKHVTANDLSDWSRVFAECYLLNNKPSREYQELINHLNALPGSDGWFTEHYGGDPEVKTAIKKPFQIKNTRKLDAIREEIDRLSLIGIERAVALSSLILALDSVDSTLGHYVSYLAEWSPRSYKDLTLKVPAVFIPEGSNSVSQSDIFSILPSTDVDLAYLDPPYGSNNEKMPPSRVRYASYYHIWSTVIRNDRPQLFGKASRREDTRDTIAASLFEEFRRGDDGKYIALQAIEKVIKQVSARHVLLSYSSGGRATKGELYDILSTSGKVKKIMEIDYKKNVMAAMSWTNDWVSDSGAHKEYLFLVEKI
jgi:adenine-specific DNA-methyltransferase